MSVTAVQAKGVERTGYYQGENFLDAACSILALVRGSFRVPCL
jgi:hypothetical protein